LVTGEITALPGVAEVDVAGRVLVRAQGAPAEDDVRAAVAEAGFTYEGAVDLVPQPLAGILPR
jgi:copper chaperone CopZ